MKNRSSDIRSIVLDNGVICCISECSCKSGLRSKIIIGYTDDKSNSIKSRIHTKCMVCFGEETISVEEATRNSEDYNE